MKNDIKYDGNSWSGNIISYRVYPVTEETCAFEVYRMKYEDERQFYRQGRTDYTIQSNVYIKNIDEFNRQMQERCIIHGYDFPVNESLNEKNDFLSKHYFINIRKYDENARDAINELNRDADEYYVRYHDRFWGDSRSSSDEAIRNAELLEKADREIGDGITVVECINVGQANFSIGYDAGNNPKAVFDIGIPSKRNKFWKNKISGLSGDGIVVVSHYDADHIRGYNKLPEAVKERVWILPERRLNPTPLERNLLAWLNESKIVFLRNIDYNKVKFNLKKHTVQIGNVNIFRGNEKKQDRNQSTDENARSLICQITGRKTALLPGDSLYGEFPCRFSADYLVVPHHCCAYLNNIPTGKLDLDRIEKVIIFAGGHNGYHHPNISHLNGLGFSLNDKRIIYLLKNAIVFDRKNRVNYKIPICPDIYKIILS